jgi:rRNA maturation endonuclease Nob1
MNLEKEHRENLKDYYKFVRICKTCRKEYGSDSKAPKGDCPICEMKLQSKGSAFDKSKKVFHTKKFFKHKIY